MKKITLISTIVSIFLVTLLTDAVFSGEMDHSSHSEKSGKMIHHSTVEGCTLMYHLIDMSEHIKNMPEMAGTYHLMVYIKNDHGDEIGHAKVGYLVTGPDQSEQKVMTMAMGGGFGADVKLKDSGTYNITIKALIGEKKLIDRFTYEIK